MVLRVSSGTVDFRFQQVQALLTEYLGGNSQQEQQAKLEDCELNLSCLACGTRIPASVDVSRLCDEGVYYRTLPYPSRSLAGRLDLVYIHPSLCQKRRGNPCPTGIATLFATWTTPPPALQKRFGSSTPLPVELTSRRRTSHRYHSPP